jgi:hypothetical protein
MQIFGSPISKTASADLPELSERFWFWRGASGQNYIHSVYAPDSCPPLPGAVYVGVKRSGSMRIAVAVGRFGPFWDHSSPMALTKSFSDCDEVHVHLLARSPESAEAVRADLVAAMLDNVPAGFAEESRSQPHSNHMRGEQFQACIMNAQLPQMQDRIGHILAA